MSIDEKQIILEWVKMTKKALQTARRIFKDEDLNSVPLLRNIAFRNLKLVDETVEDFYALPVDMVVIALEKDEKREIEKEVKACQKLAWSIFHQLQFVHWQK
ncbi:MAG: hypothetical protein ACTSRR_10800 [Candidatus Heimdallarchaeaceae archaeon]